MNLQKTIILAANCMVLLFCLLLLPIPTNGQLLNNLQWGATVDGLQMSVSIVDSRKTDVPELQFIISNDGERDAILNLGTMLDNGRVQLPDKIGFNLTDANGKTRKFDFFDARYAAVAGRVDDYIIPLRVGSTYELKIGLDKFYSSGTNEIASKLPTGKYRLTGQFQGDGAEVHNLDIKSWQGKLQSNILTIEK